MQDDSEIMSGDTMKEETERLKIAVPAPPTTPFAAEKPSSSSSSEDDDIVTQLLQVRSFEPPPSIDDDDLPVANVVGRYARTDMEDVSVSSPPPLRHIEFVGNEGGDPLDEEDEETPVNFEAFSVDASLVSSNQFMGDSDASASTTPQNCYGIVHVRVLRAQHLSCPVHSNCSVIYRLHPWKGKVRSSFKVTTFAIPSTATSVPQHHGVCAHWGDPEEIEFSKLVHAYTDPLSSPIPTLQIDLLFCPVVGWMEFTMCSFRLDCTRLFQEPQQIHSQWYTTASSSDHLAKATSYPWLQVEAFFEPAVSSVAATMASTDADLHSEMPLLVSSLPPPIEKESTATTTPEVDLSATTTIPGDASVTVQSKGAYTVRTVSSTLATTPQHLLQRTQYRWTPAFCCVCHKSLLSLLKTTSWRCERCSVDCCEDCRLQVDVQLPCGSDVAQAAVRHAIQNQWNIDQLLHIMAPPPTTSTADTTLTDVSERSNRETASLVDGVARGLGVLHLKLSRAYILQEALPAEADPHTTILSHPPPPLRPGDYYVRLLWGAGHVFRKADSLRTRTIQQCSGRMNLDFEKETWRLVVYVVSC
jgi:hypothetical protein